MKQGDLVELSSYGARLKWNYPISRSGFGRQLGLVVKLSDSNPPYYKVRWNDCRIAVPNWAAYHRRELKHAGVAQLEE